MSGEIIVRRCEPMLPIVSSDEMEGDEGLVLFFPPPPPGKVEHFVEPIVTAIIRDVQALGLSLKECAARQGLKASKVQYWYDSNKGNFRNVVDKARIDNKALHISRLVEAKDMRKIKASAFVLERKHRDEYGKSQDMRITPGEVPKKQVMRIGDKDYEF